ncbi:hypothetical protein [Limnohabitans sp.]
MYQHRQTYCPRPSRRRVLAQTLRAAVRAVLRALTLFGALALLALLFGWSDRP